MIISIFMCMIVCNIDAYMQFETCNVFFTTKIQKLNLNISNYSIKLFSLKICHKFNAFIDVVNVNTLFY